MYEQHPERFAEATAYEKNGFTWMDEESLDELARPERIAEIKETHLRSGTHEQASKSAYLLEVLDECEGVGCTACFI